MGIRKKGGLGPAVERFVLACLLLLCSPSFVRAQEEGAFRGGEVKAWRDNFATLVNLVRENCRQILDSEGCSQSSSARTGTPYQLNVVGEPAEFRLRQVWQEIDVLRVRIVEDIFSAPAGSYIPESHWPKYVAALRELDSYSRSDDFATRAVVELLSESLMQNWLVTYYDQSVRHALFDQDIQQIGGVLGAFLVGPVASTVISGRPGPGATRLLDPTGKSLNTPGFMAARTSAWLPESFQKIRQFWPLKAFSAKLSALSFIVAGGGLAAEAQAAPDFDFPPSPAHFIHFYYNARPSYVGDCLHGMARCEESLEDWEQRALGSTVSAFVGVLAGGTKGILHVNALAGQVVAAKRLMQISVQGILLGLAADWGFYRLWQWRGREESTIQLTAALRQARQDAQREVFSEEKWQTRMAALYHDLNQLEITSLAETESDYRYQLRLMNILFELERTHQEGNFTRNLRATIDELGQLRKESRRISEMFEVEISQVAMDELIEHLNWLECWRLSIKRRETVSGAYDRETQCNPLTLNGRSRFVWRKAVGRMVAALDTDRFNAFSGELIRVTELRERLEGMEKENSIELVSSKAKGVDQKKTNKFVGIEKMLAARIGILKEEEVFLRKFIGTNNSEQPQTQQFRERMRKLLISLGPS